MCPKKRTQGRGGIERETVGFLDVEDEFLVEDAAGEIINEDEGEESDSPEDYETELDCTGEVEEGTLRDNSISTNGSMVIIRDLGSWLRSPYSEV